MFKNFTSILTSSIQRGDAKRIMSVIVSPFLFCKKNKVSQGNVYNLKIECYDKYVSKKVRHIFLNIKVKKTYYS